MKHQMISSDGGFLWTEIATATARSWAEIMAGEWR